MRRMPVGVSKAREVLSLSLEEREAPVPKTIIL
jgi:hypothetical protein